MYTHNIYFHGEISKIPKLMTKKKIIWSCVHCLFTVTEYLNFNTYHVMGRFSRRQTANIFFLENRICHANYLPKETICTKCKILFPMK